MMAALHRPKPAGPGTAAPSGIPSSERMVTCLPAATREAGQAEAPTGSWTPRFTSDRHGGSHAAVLTGFLPHGTRLPPQPRGFTDVTGQMIQWRLILKKGANVCLSF